VDPYLLLETSQRGGKAAPHQLYEAKIRTVIFAYLSTFDFPSSSFNENGSDFFVLHSFPLWDGIDAIAIPTAVTPIS